MNYDAWFDSDGGYYDVEKMDTRYINNCVRQIEKAAIRWRFSTLDELTDEEKAKINKPFNPAWCIAHALNYLKEFEVELSSRDADLSLVQNVIDKMTDLRM